MITAATLRDPKVDGRLEALPAIGGADGTRGDLPAVKLFDPIGQAFWVIWEYDPDEDMGYGLCDLGMGFPEIGYVSVKELRAIGRGRLPIEQDLYVATRFEGYRSRSIDIPEWIA